MSLRALYAELHKSVSATITIRRRDLRSRAPLRLKRYLAEVRYTGLNSPVMPAMFLSLDISPRDLRLMTAVPLREGALIAITFEDDSRVYVLGKVRSSRLATANPRILRERSFDYRSEIQFLAGTPGEASAMAAFWAEINRSLAPVGRT